MFADMVRSGARDYQNDVVMEAQASGRRRTFMEAFGRPNDGHDWILENRGLPALPEATDEGMLL